MDELIRTVPPLHFSETDIFYILRPGPCEGHAAFHGTTAALAFIFGLKSLGETGYDFCGNLFTTLTAHFMPCSVERPAWVNH